MYDVLLHDCRQGEKVLASGLDHEHACAVAKTEAQRLGVGRMFLAGSEPGPTRDVVLIVEAPKRAAA